VGRKDSAAMRARQRAVASRVERLIGRADQQRPIGPAQRADIKDAVRSGRAVLRRWERANAAANAATTDVGVALSQLVTKGLTQAQAFDALGLTVGVGRRLLRGVDARKGRLSDPSSTGSDAVVADGIPASQPDRDSHRGDRNGVD
jgi:hypothetical protein